MRTKGGKSEHHRAGRRVTRIRFWIHTGMSAVKPHDGKCHREYTATHSQGWGVRVKRWGKSPPPQEQSRGHGKPRPVQDQIGSPGTARSEFRLVRNRLRVWVAQINDSLRGRPRRQNSAYNPTEIIFLRMVKIVRNKKKHPIAARQSIIFA